MDLPFLMLVVLLTGIGVITVFSASYATAASQGRGATYFFLRQAVFAVLGIVGMYIISRINYQHFRWMSVFALLAAFACLLLVLTPLGYGWDTVGAQRWLRIPIAGSVQPSEVAKLGVILYFSARLSKRSSEKKRKYDTKTTLGAILQILDNWGLMELIPYGVILLIILILMYFEPHMSGAILIMVAAAAVLFAGGVNLRWFALGGTFVVGFLLLTMQGYQSLRIKIWQDPWAYPRDGGYQIIQSLYAIGSGGLFGVGFGQSRQKQLFLPEPENDFIFSIWCEEMGLVGAAVVLVLFALLVLRGYWIALHARDRFGSLLTVGIITLMAVQVFLNISVVTNLLPTTGISLPFFSYGGTALLIQLAMMGIVLSVSRQIPAPKQG
ncbi:MAG: cell division protein FtsW [Oscillospiraceae bacterium]|nr:cell division protein FtsW [Oscillospiraceae bacterium]